MRRKINKNQRGFTIIELLIATVVFSILLLVMLEAFIRTGDLFYKGVSMSKTQEDARNIVQSVSDDIQFTNAQAPVITAAPGASGVFCIGNHRYAYQIGAYVTPGGNYGLARDDVPSGCPAVGSASGQQQLGAKGGEVQMLDADMQLNSLSIACSNTQVGHCTISIHVVFYSAPGTPGTPAFLNAADQLFMGTGSHTSQASNAECKGSLNDTSLCATVDYSSTVMVNST